MKGDTAIALMTIRLSSPVRYGSNREIVHQKKAPDFPAPSKPYKAKKLWRNSKIYCCAIWQPIRGHTRSGWAEGCDIKTNGFPQKDTVLELHLNDRSVHIFSFKHAQHLSMPIPLGSKGMNFTEQ
jgi:hypothetical protein